MWISVSFTLTVCADMASDLPIAPEGLVRVGSDWEDQQRRLERSACGGLQEKVRGWDGSGVSIPELPSSASSLMRVIGDARVPRGQAGPGGP